MGGHKRGYKYGNFRYNSYSGTYNPAYNLQLPMNLQVGLRRHNVTPWSGTAGFQGLGFQALGYGV